MVTYHLTLDINKEIYCQIHTNDKFLRINEAT